MISVLFSSAGRRVELMGCFRKAASELGVGLRVVAADMVPDWSPACRLADSSRHVPPCTEEGFVDAVLTICAESHVNLIVPTIDTELPVYAESRNEFERAGVQVLVASPEIIRILGDKKLTVEFFRQHGIPSPDTWTANHCLSHPESVPWPVLAKPRHGSASKGIKVVQGPEELGIDETMDAGLVLQSICKGQEYTVNAFFDGSGHCVCSVPHLRRLVRDGEVCFGETRRVDGFSDIADRLAAAMPSYYGPLCFQGIVNDDEEISVFEVNARFGGGYPLCDRSGGRFARWILQRLRGQIPDYSNQWEEGLRMLRYDSAVFVRRGDL